MNMQEQLQFLADVGIDVTLNDLPINRLEVPYVPFVLRPRPKRNMDSAVISTTSPILSAPGAEAILISNKIEESVHSNLDQCQTLDDLKKVLKEFSSHHPLALTARNIVFSDGNPQSKIMFVGEAPGADEDIQGKPFVGMSGQLLDRMLSCIGLNRDNIYITNMVPYRPPANRQPTTEELAVFLPFVQKHIELIQPQILVCLGGVSAKTLLNSKEGIMKLRGQWHDYPVSDQKSILATAIFHPAFLLRSPLQKRLVWHDLLMIQEKLNNA